MQTTIERAPQQIGQEGAEETRHPPRPSTVDHCAVGPVRPLRRTSFERLLSLS
jgi:hypothetical protein